MNAGRQEAAAAGNDGEDPLAPNESDSDSSNNDTDNEK